MEAKHLQNFLNNPRIHIVFAIIARLNPFYLNFPFQSLLGTFAMELAKTKCNFVKNFKMVLTIAFQ